MQKKSWMGFSIACVALWATALAAQEKRAGSNATAAGPPVAQGVYYRAASGWVPLQTTLLLPFLDSGVKEMLGVRSRIAIAEMPGPHAAIRIIDARPTFYVRGFSPRELYLVRVIEKQDYRELRMSASYHARSPQFRAKDLNDFELEPVAPDLVGLTPRADLKPGEYVVASVPEPGYRWIRFGFEFGVSGGTSGR